MKYLISPVEITRRKKAYTTLSISLIIGLFLASIIFSFPISPGGYLLVGSLVFLIGASSFIFFHHLSPIKIILSNQSLTRKHDQVSEEYLLTKVSRVEIKWTTNHTIREIYLWLNDGKSVFITALNNFEQFREDLLGKLNRSVAVQEKHELLDFDHPLFYSILGLVISNVSVLTIRLMSNVNYQNAQILSLVFFIYTLILGIYFAVAKPISRRCGDNTQIADYIMGILMVGAGIMVLFLIFN